MRLLNGLGMITPSQHNITVITIKSMCFAYANSIAFYQMFDNYKQYLFTIYLEGQSVIMIVITCETPEKGIFFWRQKTGFSDEWLWISRSSSWSAPDQWSIPVPNGSFA